MIVQWSLGSVFFFVLCFMSSVIFFTGAYTEGGLHSRLIHFTIVAVTSAFEGEFFSVCANNLMDNKAPCDPSVSFFVVGFAGSEKGSPVFI